jgi:hypothetical protein
MDFFTVEHVLRMGLELTLGVCIKLFCDNGRIHWRDFVNDALFWLPGFQQQPGDGVARQVSASLAAPADDLTPLAAR